jgi:negative regulator of replication initiation
VTGALRDSDSEYARAMKTIELSDEELRLLIAAVHSYLDDFGHEEADVLRRAKQLLAKLQSSAE